MTTPADHSDRDHAKYAPSAAAGWLNCTSRIALSAGIESKSNQYAEEGTECHEAAANILMGFPFDDVCAPLSDEQREIVEEYTNYVFDLIDTLHDKFGSKNVKIWIEERVRCGNHDDYHGTADFAALASRTFGLVDLKAGYGPVTPRNEDGSLNEQLASYAVLALDHHQLWEKVDRVRLTIVQPRVYDKPQTITVGIRELQEFYDRALDTIERIEKGDTEIKPGAWCKYCPARGRCPALRDEAVAKAKIIFDDPKEARLYEPDELIEILNEAEMIQTHIDGVRAHVYRELEKGRLTGKGWKLVPKRAMSKWTEFDVLESELYKRGFIPELIYNSKPKTPNQLTKVLKEKKINIDLGRYFVKESSGLTLVRDTDERPATKADPFGDD